MRVSNVKAEEIVGEDNLVINAGFIRKASVFIGGTSWKPDMLVESQIKKNISDVLMIENQQSVP